MVNDKHSRSLERSTKEPVYSAISTGIRGSKSRVSDLDEDIAISLSPDHVIIY